MRKYPTLIVSLLLLSSFGLWLREMDAHFQLARNPSEFITSRAEAAERLDELHRRVLQKELIKELAPVLWNSRTTDAAYILGEIGDKEALTRLRESDSQFHLYGGNTSAFIDGAIDRLEARLNGRRLSRF